MITDEEGVILAQNSRCNYYSKKGIFFRPGVHFPTYLDNREASSFLHYKNADPGVPYECKLVGLHQAEGRSFYVMFNMQKLESNPKNNDYIITLSPVDSHLSNDETIRKERDFYKNLLDSLPADIAVFDPQFRYTYVNKNAIKDDVTRAWLIGRTDLEYCLHRNLPIEIGQKRQSRLYKLREEGNEYSFEEKISRNNNTEYHLRNMRPILNKEGVMTNIIGYGINITAQKVSELKNQEQALAIEASHDGIAIVNSDQTYRYMNQSHADLFGYSDREELIGKSWSMFYEENELDRVIADLAPVLLKDKKWRGETIAKKKNGEYINVDVSVTLVEDNSMICLVRDISKRKKEEEQLKRLAVVASQTNSFVIFTNRNHEIEWMNDAFQKFSEFKNNELIHQKIDTVFNQNRSASDIDRFVNCINEASPFIGELSFTKKQGKQRWLQINASPIINEKGEIINYVIVANDITLTKETKENYRQMLEKEMELNRLKSQFINLASHEFRTPLANIISSVDILEILNSSEHPQPERVEKHLANIAGDVDRMNNIMTNIFDVGKAETIKSNFHPEIGNISTFIKSIISTFENKNTTHKILLTESGQIKPLSFDKNLLDHVITNLINNAIKYSPLNENIALTIHYQNNKVEICVIDHGVGIPKKDQKQLFTSFYRASNVKNIKGTGLGLVIVKQFIEQHNGTVEIISEENEGCIVKLTLPLLNN
jgi:PAS domain S-box-containing protein